MNVPFGEYLPDRPPIATPGVNQLGNFIPVQDGYRPLLSLSATSLGGIDATCLGAARGRSQTGQTFLVAGTASKLYLATTDVLTDVSKLGGYHVASGDRWTFALYDNTLIAANVSDPPQYYTFGSSTAFADLSADASSGAQCAVFRDFAVLGNLIGRGVNAAAIGTLEGGVHWSAFGNPTSWPQVGTDTAIGLQSDFQPLRGSGGALQALVAGGDYCAVLQERALWRMDYVGGSDIFSFTAIEHGRGCVAPGAAIRVGNFVYFPSEDGFYAFNGAFSVPIGSEKVDRTFLASIDQSRLAEVTVDQWPAYDCVVWQVPVKGVAPTVYQLFIYHYKLNRWGTATLPLERLVTALPIQASLDSYTAANVMDSGALANVNLDTQVATPFGDSGAFDTTHSFATFSGRPLQAAISSGDLEPFPGQVAMIRAIRPIFASDVPTSVPSIQAYIQSRMRAADVPVFVTASAMDATGKCDLRATGRYLRPFLSITATDPYVIQGLDLDAVPGGPR